MLEMIGVKSGYGDLMALHELSLSVQKGAIVALLGANGAGKSTTLKTISGIVRPKSGSILLSGERIDTLSVRAIVAKGVIHCPEGRQVFPEMSVLDNLRLGFFTRRGRKTFQGELDRVYDFLPRLKERSNQQAGTLSGGEQQMLAIGRALMANPKLLLLDEPSLGLAPIVIEEIKRVIAQLRDSGVTILLVEQSVNLALSLADYAYILSSGRVVLCGESSKLKADPRIQDIYLGGSGAFLEPRTS
jgi:branched-chain amino acid transport system ATP-binding protein